MRRLTILLLVPFLLALKAGEMAPAFSAKNQDGKVVRLSDYRGKYVLIFFYPKDDTPGCTKEACLFRDEYSNLKKKNTVVLGVSKQGEESHQKFKAKHKLPFDLLVDSDGSISQSFDVGSMPIFGLTHRQSYLIGPDGKVLKFYEDVEPAVHAKQVLDDIKTPSEK